MKYILRPMSVHRPSGAVRAAVCLMLLSAVLRIVYYVLTPASPSEWILRLVLPLAAVGCFLLGAAAKRHSVPLFLLSVALGVAFFALKTTDFTPLHRTLCLLLYTTVLVLFSLTILGVIPTKRLLYPLFGLPLLYHIFVEDTQYYFFASPPVPFREWLPEMSVLCIMGALLALSFALEKTTAATEEHE